MEKVSACAVYASKTDNSVKMIKHATDGGGVEKVGTLCGLREHN